MLRTRDSSSVAGSGACSALRIRPDPSGRPPRAQAAVSCRGLRTMASTGRSGVGRGAELVERLRRIEVSALCDADKGLPVVDAAIRAMVPDVRMAGPALTVVAEDDHLPVFSALADARAGEVLIIVTHGHRLAV